MNKDIILDIKSTDIILGIDFGSTNTVITYFENNKPKILMDGVFKSIKSKIGIKNGIYSCGNYLSLNNDNIIHSFKTKIGNENLDEILLIFFNHLKTLILNKFPNCNLKSVITVPSNFNDIQREIIKKNFISIGFNVIRIINEPSAAALSYGLTSTCQDEEKILVIDVGGGTTDISLLLKDNGFFEVKYSIGLNDLGGNDFTKVIYDFILKQYPDFSNDKLIKLWYICQNAKEKLSWIDNYEIKIPNYNNKNDLIFNLNIKKFNNLCNNLIDKFESILQNIYDQFVDIKYIIMVGNSSKIPIIKTTIENIFKKQPWMHPNLESVVSEGACLYGAILENIYKSDDNIVLLDVLPLSLGVETIDGSFSVIIPKDTPIPIKRTQKYTTDTPSDKNVKIKVYQGERVIANKNTLIGEFIFDKITTGGTPQIDITFKVDSNSIITVIVTDKKSGIEKNILIKDIPKLDQNEINKIIDIANINNKTDENEMIKYSRIYILNTQIETAMNNIKLNHLIDNNIKNDLLNKLCDIESKIELSNNTELLVLIKLMDDEFINWTQNNIDIVPDTNQSDLEKIIFTELKDELQSKIIMLLNKNPDWKEYLEPILDDLQLTNISLEYIQDKLTILKDLEDNDNTDHKEQFKNLCLFIKTQIEENKIELSNDKLNELFNLINKSLELLESTNNIDWLKEIDNFNFVCDKIYNNY
jgi:molecular chaperone DnaK